MDVLKEPQSSTRLIVLLPGCLANSTDLARKIHWMADQEDLAVLYLVQVEDEENRLAISRCMATMKAVTSGNRLAVESKLTDTTNWMKDLQKMACPGDIIVCQEEQTALNGFFKLLPIRDLLPHYLNIPIRTLSGYYHPDRSMARKWFHELITLSGFLIIMAFFTWLQIRLDQALEGSLQTIFVIGTFGAELGALLTWHKLVDP